MTKTIKTAQSLTEALAQVEASIAADGGVPASAAGAFAALRKTVYSAAELLLDAGKLEVDQAIKDAKAKLKG